MIVIIATVKEGQSYQLKNNQNCTLHLSYTFRLNVATVSLFAEK